MALDVATLSAGADLSHTPRRPAAMAQLAEGRTRLLRHACRRAIIGAHDARRQFRRPTVSGTPATGQDASSCRHRVRCRCSRRTFSATTRAGSGSGNGTGTGAISPDVGDRPAQNTALRIPKSTLELVMVLDNTGSMSDYASSDKTQGTKIAGLRTAAAEPRDGTSSASIVERFVHRPRAVHDDGQRRQCADIGRKLADASLQPTTRRIYR